MLATLRALTLGPVLSPASRQQLVAWLVANQTGDKRLRAGLPAGWKVGDKTGSWGDGKVGTTNDIAAAKRGSPSTRLRSSPASSAPPRTPSTVSRSSSETRQVLQTTTHGPSAAGRSRLKTRSPPGPSRRCGTGA
jgi:beta-lactamase class A